MQKKNMIDHPEGGRYLEVFRSPRKVQCGTRVRPALTHIYFSLRHGEVSRFHRVQSDEVWNLYRGEGIRLYLWDGKEEKTSEVILSAEKEEFCHTVPAGWWQAAEPLGEECLVGCTVGPGFEFEDFELIHPESVEGVQLLAMEDVPDRLVVLN